uniref:Chromodomain-helicase-DNA-binding protein 1-like n=1 Tax=Denticeps clupeoides TaxID=299321 RepID=A0AAY4E2T3_9TELE
MARFVQRTRRIPEKEKTALSERDLHRWGLSAKIQLKSYQLDGAWWLTQCLKHQEGCILADEMGLGKTCQAICLLLYVVGAQGESGPFLVVCPLSVLETWREELVRFSPGLSVTCYIGTKERRAELQEGLLNGGPFDVLLTTFEMSKIDAAFLKRWSWKILVVDEAHNLKNQNCGLHRTLCEYNVGFRLLMTGTPIQNNLQEVYALLSFVQPSLFPRSDAEEFATAFAHVQTEPAVASELHRVLQPFLLRREKAKVATDLPEKMELIVYHGMSGLQKRLYKAILMKDRGAFGEDQTKEIQLMNVLMQLRKAVVHPYLFDDVEPEPFEIGDHLIEASGKLCLLDCILACLHERGHRVLLFSQMSRTLDILQDYVEYRGYSYERIDGSVRGEERNLAIKNFRTNNRFIFLLTTKTGGVGMNLTSADTVIFMDSDFNPQNDLQAMARAHRIGQTRKVKVIRLLGRDTVEEIVYRRAMSKLQLTDVVIQEGRFSLLDQVKSAAAGLKLSEILKFGVDKLLSSEESSVKDVDVEKILGKSHHGQWVIDADPTLPPEQEEKEESTADDQRDMYYFEGKDYSAQPSAEDQKAYDLLMEEQLALTEESGEQGRALRHKAGVSLAGPLKGPPRKKRILSEAERELQGQRRQEAAAKRAKVQADRKKKLDEKKHQKKMEWWRNNGYKSLCLPFADTDEEEEEDDGVEASFMDSEHRAIRYVLGDVTDPQAAEDAVLVHCVDDSGHWGRGGLFTALDCRSDEPQKQYERAGEMKDLELGHVLLFPINDKVSRLDRRDYLALIVAQTRDKSNNLSGIKLSALDEGLKKIYRAAKEKRASVHLPRIGHSTKGFNWYGTERLIRKHLAAKGIPTFIYYFKKGAQGSVSSSHTTASGSSAPAPKPHPSPISSTLPISPETASREEDSQEPGGSGGAPTPFSLSDFMSGVHVFFYNVPAEERKRLARYLITYPYHGHFNALLVYAKIC